MIWPCDLMTYFKWHSLLSNLPCGGGRPLSLPDQQNNGAMNELYDVIRFAYVSGYKSWTKPFHRPTRRTIITLMLLLCGDVELNLGPVNKSIYPCGFCELRVNWSHKALCCDSCSLWYHKTCLSMASGDFAHLENESNTSWHCIRCRTPLSVTYHSKPF